MLDKVRDDIYEYFKKELAPKIREGVGIVGIEKMAMGAFNSKYMIVAKQYKNSIRVSFNLKSNGIIYFLAETKLGEDDFPFLEPSYLWRNF